MSAAIPRTSATRVKTQITAMPPIIQAMPAPFIMSYVIAILLWFVSSHHRTLVGAGQVVPLPIVEPVNYAAPTCQVTAPR
jgi:hypothetical protein